MKSKINLTILIFLLLTFENCNTILMRSSRDRNLDDWITFKVPAGKESQPNQSSIQKKELCGININEPFFRHRILEKMIILENTGKYKHINVYFKSLIKDDCVIVEYEI